MYQLHRIRYSISITAIFLFFLASLPFCLASPGIEEFGKLPTIQSMPISPDGKHIAFIRDNSDGRVLLVYALKKEGSEPVGARLPDEITGRNVYFASNTLVVLTASDTMRVVGFRSKFEKSGAFVFSIEDNQTKLLLNKTRGLYPAQTGLGRIVGIDSDTGFAYMPALAGKSDPIRNLYKVSLKTGLGMPHARGSSGTVDWFVSQDGGVLVRVDFENDAKEYRIYSHKNMDTLDRLRCLPFRY